MSAPAGQTAAEHVEVRLLKAEECAAARQVADAALRARSVEQGWHHPAPTEQSRARGVDRVEHLQRTDPDGAWVAVRDGEPVGVALALRRGPLWFLSLLMVAPGLQSQGVGRRLLEGALQTAGGHDVIMSSSAPGALRRYWSAGFALHPGYVVSGTLDRALLPAVPGVREGDVDRDAGLVEGLAARLRARRTGPTSRSSTGTGNGCSSCPTAASPSCGRGSCAADEDAAEQLLWAALAEAGPEPEVELVLGLQQWAVRVALQARLVLRPDTSLCVRGTAGPSPLHLPGGAYG